MTEFMITVDTSPTDITYPTVRAYAGYLFTVTQTEETYAVEPIRDSGGNIVSDADSRRYGYHGDSDEPASAMYLGDNDEYPGHSYYILSDSPELEYLAPGWEHVPIPPEVGWYRCGEHTTVHCIGVDSSDHMLGYYIGADR